MDRDLASVSALRMALGVGNKGAGVMEKRKALYLTGIIAVIAALLAH